MKPNAPRYLRRVFVSEGVVVASQGGAGEWVEVAFFGGAGKKKLIVAYANLKKVG